MKAVIYVHLEADTGNPFYVGIGKTEARSKELRKRSAHHRNVASKHGVKVLVLGTVSSWKAACFWEKKLIAGYKRSGYRLVNMTAGGDGMVEPTEEVRSRISTNVSKYLLSLGEAHFSKREEVRKKTSESLKGRLKSELHIQNLRASLNAPGRISPNKRVEKRCKQSASLKSKGDKHSSKNPITRAKMKAFWCTQKALFLLWHRENVMHQNYFGA